MRHGEQAGKPFLPSAISGAFWPAGASLDRKVSEVRGCPRLAHRLAVTRSGLLDARRSAAWVSRHSLQPMPLAISQALHTPTIGNYGSPRKLRLSSAISPVFRRSGPPCSARGEGNFSPKEGMIHAYSGYPPMGEPPHPVDPWHQTHALRSRTRAMGSRAPSSRRRCCVAPPRPREGTQSEAVLSLCGLRLPSPLCVLVCLQSSNRGSKRSKQEQIDANTQQGVNGR